MRNRRRREEKERKRRKRGKGEVKQKKRHRRTRREVMRREAKEKQKKKEVARGKKGKRERKKISSTHPSKVIHLIHFHPPHYLILNFFTFLSRHFTFSSSKISDPFFSFPGNEATSSRCDFAYRSSAECDHSDSAARSSAATLDEAKGSRKESYPG